VNVNVNVQRTRKRSFHSSQTTEKRMSLAELLLPEWDQEMANTRKVLERAPSERLGWKPHEKSMTLGQLAGLCAILPWWCTTTFDRQELDFQDPEVQATLKPFNSTQEIVAAFERKVVEGRDWLARAGDGDFAMPWTLRSGDNVIFTLPRTTVYRSFVLNHLVHHRGQLTVYLRLLDVPVPALYGPSADES
jgi:uncharacterized damage-inducible protein DinB